MNREQWLRVQAAWGAECDALAVRAAPVQGVFKATLRTDDVPYGVYYTARFDAGAEGAVPDAAGHVDFVVPLAAFEPRLQGKRWAKGPGLTSFEHVRSFGFMVGDGQEGPFELRVAALHAVNTGAHGWTVPTGGLPGVAQHVLQEDGAVVLVRVPADASPPREPAEAEEEL